LDGKLQFLADAEDMNLLGDIADTITKNRGTSIDASEETDLEINGRKLNIRRSLITRMQMDIMT
jgi:hypothetical protein